MKRGLVCSAAIALTAAWWAPRVLACKPDLVGEPTRVSPTADAALPTNGRIVLDRAGGLLRGEFGDSLLEVEVHHPELRSDRERVALRVVQKYDRHDGATVVLTAAHQLRSSTSYTLAFDPPLDDATPGAPGRPHRQTIGRRRDGSPDRPRKRRCIAVAVATLTATWPSTFATADAAWIRVEWRQHGERGGGLPLTRRRTARSGSGFPRTTLQLRLTAIDFAGNECGRPGRPLEVVMPSGTPAKSQRSRILLPSNDST